MYFSCSLEKHGCAVSVWRRSRFSHESMMICVESLTCVDGYISKRIRTFCHFSQQKEEDTQSEINSVLIFWLDFVESREVGNYDEEKTTLKSRTIRRHGPHHLKNKLYTLVVGRSAMGKTIFVFTTCPKRGFAVTDAVTWIKLFDRVDNVLEKSSEARGLMWYGKIRASWKRILIDSIYDKLGAVGKSTFRKRQYEERVLYSSALTTEQHTDT